MTHEIRTPLNGIVGNISLIDDTELTEQQAEYVRNMKISGEILMQHVDTVMDITRFETGKMQFSDRAVHLGRLVQDTVDSQTSNAERNNNRLDWRWVGDGIDWISVDPMRLQQILLNLVGNAIKFTRDGRISIELERIDPEPDAERETVEFRIIDEGIGIAEADLDHVFEDFHTADPSFDRTVEGTGLGLGIAKRFAEGLGGEIGAESEPGVGSVFWLRLPVARAEPPRDADTPDDGVLSTGPLRVLVVEDNEINRHVVREMLHSFGHDVAEVDNGQSAVDLAHSERFDLIFMDISMPVMDGLEATRRIRADGGASSAVPIIALSANVLPDAQARFVAAGMTDFLGKPFTKPELWELLARHNAGTTAAPAAVSDAGNAHVPDEIHSRYFEVFRTETHDLVEWLDSGPTDLQEIAFRSHKIAGGAAAFEAHDLRQSLLDLERAALSGDPTEVRRKTEAALPHLARLAGQRLPI